MNRLTGRAWSKLGLIAPLLALTALLFSPVTVSAHSFLVASDPPDGALLAQAPARIVLVFSSAVTSDFTRVELVEAGGTRYQPLSVVVDKVQPLLVTVTLPTIPVGSYRISFTTHDRVDLHETSGSIVFGVGTAPASARAIPTPAPAKPAEYLTRWAGFAGLAALDGGLLLALFIVPGLANSRPRRRAQSALLALAAGGSFLVLISATVLIVVQAAALGSDLVRTLPLVLTGTEYGSRWLANAALSIVLSVFLLVLYRRAGRGGVAGLVADVRRLGGWALLTTESRAVLLAIGVAGVAGVSGHASNSTGLSLPEVVLRTVHLTAMGVWAGGVLALVFAVIVLRRSGDRSPASALKLVGGFGPYAAVGLALLGITGLLLSGQQVASITALLSTPYGAVLVAKVIGVGLVACVALRHAILTLRELTGRRPARAPRGLLVTLGIEAGGALAVILMAAVLGSSAPARGLQFEPAAAPAATLVTQERNALLASVSMKPNREGPNLLSVQVVDTRRPSPAPIERVTLVLKRPGSGSPSEQFPTARSGNRYDAGTVSAVTGDLLISVIITRVGLGSTLIDVPWRVNPPEVQRAPVVISSEPLAPLVNLGAVLLALVAAIALAGGFVLRLRSTLRTSRLADQGRSENAPGGNRGRDSVPDLTLRSRPAEVGSDALDGEVATRPPAALVTAAPGQHR